MTAQRPSLYRDVARLRIGRWVVKRTNEWSTEFLRAQMVTSLDAFAEVRNWVEGWEVEEVFHGKTIERRVPRGPALLVEPEFVQSPNEKVLIITVVRRNATTLEGAISFGKGPAIDVTGLGVRLAQLYSAFDRMNRG